MIDRARAAGVLALTTSIVLSALGQLCMKVGMQKMHLVADTFLSVEPSDWSLLEPAVWWTTIGLAAYALSLASWLLVLVRFPLSYAYPFLGLSYVLVYVGATQWSELAEPVTPLRTVGTILVIAGVAILSLDKTTERGANGPKRSGAP